MGLKTTLPWWQKWRSRFSKEAIVAKLRPLPQPKLTRLASVGQSIIVISLAATSSLGILRQLGWTEGLELLAYDRSIQSRSIPEPDTRLLIVGITEADIQAQQKYPLSDETIYQLLRKLKTYRPRAIGLDIYRDVPQPPGRDRLMEYLQDEGERIVTVCQLGRGNEDLGVPPPPGLSNSHLGFADLAIDEDGVIRRALLAGTPLKSSECRVKLSFALQLVRHYLEPDKIKAKFTEGTLIFGDVPIPRIRHNTGGYQNVEADGYEILLKYHSPDNVAKMVSLTDVLQGRIERDWVRDRIVLIGITAPSINDYFFTPHSSRRDWGDRNHQMSGVEIHAHIISQLLNTVLNDEPLIRSWSENGELLWIFCWSSFGGLLGWKLRHPFRLLGGTVMAIAGLLGSGFLLFQASIWIPLFSPILGLIITGSGVLAYRAYHSQKLEQQMTERVEQQNRDLHVLKRLLEQGDRLAESDRSGTLEVTDITQNYEAEYDDDVTEIALGNAEEWERPMTVLGGRYHIITVLGSGGFGQTYLAEDIQRPKHPSCAIKHLRPMHVEGKLFEVAQRLFSTEAEILEMLGKHEQIPQLFAYFEEYQEFYLVQEYIQGTPFNQELESELENRKKISVNRVLEIVRDLLDILTFVHHYQVIHRDIKPSNIIRRHSDGKLCLIDFGAVKQFSPQLDEKTERFTVAIGTKGYAAPEQLMGQPRLCSDIYSVGTIAIYALTGVAPQKLRQDWSTGNVIWHHLAEDMDVELMDIFDKMVAYHFRDRYPSATEVLKALKPYLK
ncbi:CHASE2 domain-containing serine/threonine-protein kinase [Roseofilum casamattae]|uniref:non-specific serine/threonine protein kinase n=1 Tax=Roseofilum casamattae BLCC-M143 TaxID=3022442 RepID=A0ABT7BXN3_9CYAN|nr:CHASE2 domain-containing serine/threonine-protein kinase [Roseofilum casamattae]MDJ1183962.1 CHASE2 domain-containing serine/threonine-protein kinase [Roseofilum casamattae BLCC-M143]